jgi:hypothetical protein
VRTAPPPRRQDRPPARAAAMPTVASSNTDTSWGTRRAASGNMSGAGLAAQIRLRRSSSILSTCASKNSVKRPRSPAQWCRMTRQPSAHRACEPRSRRGSADSNACTPSRASSCTRLAHRRDVVCRQHSGDSRSRDRTRQMQRVCLVSLRRNSLESCCQARAPSR